MREKRACEIRMLTVRDAAEALRVSEKWIYAAVSSGQLPAVRLGRCVRIPEDKLRETLTASSAEQGPPSGRRAVPLDRRRRENRSAPSHVGMHARLRALGIRL
ncbi:helix-turn-helix domain-containing protein [Falsiroseomonas oryzae]|uniref:helix-turn-helix domain-containing protein n=1 Tax=Falsiroseomonas oryzae TaxID=2766473 RepID=UPI0038CC18C1